MAASERAERESRGVRLRSRGRGRRSIELIHANADCLVMTSLLTLLVGLQTPTAPPRTTPAAATFTELVPALPSGVVDALARRGIASPTPIQLAAVPQALAGESLLLHAETGSGKSLAFLLPTLLRLGGSGRKLLVVAPTRELCVQLANEAATLLPSASAVQIVAVGCTPSPEALLDASAIVCTAPEMLDALHGGEILGAACGEALRTLGAVVLDELDTLLPIGRVYGGRAEARKKLLNRKEAEAPAQQLLRAVIEACALPDLQARRNSAQLGAIRCKVSAQFGAIRRRSTPSPRPRRWWAPRPRSRGRSASSSSACCGATRTAAGTARRRQSCAQRRWRRVASRRRRAR